MKGMYLLLGVAAIAGGAYYLSTQGSTAKAAQSPTPATTAPSSSSSQSITSQISGIAGSVTKLWDSLTGKKSTSSSTTTTARTVLATDRVPRLNAPFATQVQLS